MERRAFLSTLAGGLLPAAANSRPNIVIILADDMGYGDLSCYGHPTIRTPNIDRMATEGMRFTQFYSASPYCSPSRAALLTGRLPIRSGVNVVFWPDSKGGIQPGEVTLGEALREQGYATTCVGKWHLGHLPQYLPMRHGFDSYFGIPYSNDMSPTTSPEPGAKKWPPTPLMRNETIIEKEPDQNPLTQRYTQEATKFIRESAAAKKPFFLYYAHTMPHWPQAASVGFRGKSKRGLYGDSVEEIDWSVGEVLRTLRQAGVDKNTLVLFTSDNGAAIHKREEGGSSAPFNNGKGTTWEGGMREPAIAYWPGRIQAGTVTTAFATMMDIFPTAINLAGGKAPTDRELDGEDISGVLFENKPGREALLFYYNIGVLRAARKGPWKLHVSVTPGAVLDGGGYKDLSSPYLYNVEVDPAERFNVADKQPAIVKDMLALIERHKASIKPGPPQT